MSAPTPEDRCVEVDVDDEPVRMQVAGPVSDELAGALAELVRAVRAHAAELPPVEQRCGWRGICQRPRATCPHRRPVVDAPVVGDLL